MKSKELVRTYYDALSQGYDELYGEEQRQKYAMGLVVCPPRKVVLDAGCGTGLLIERLKTMGVSEITYYLCIDLSPGMLRRALGRASSLALSHLVELVEADVEHLPVRSCSVDVAYSFTVLTCDNLLQGLYEVLRTVKACCAVSVLKASCTMQPSVEPHELRRTSNWFLKVLDAGKDWLLAVVIEGKTVQQKSQ